MRLASIFLVALDNKFDSSNIMKAFCKTNQHFLSQADSSEDDIRDLLDVCQEFFPQPFLMENKEYQQLWNRLNIVQYQEVLDRNLQ